MNRRYIQKKKIDFIIIFLVLDFIAILTMFQTSNASYESKAVGKAAMDVALYAFRYEGMNELDGVDGNVTNQSLSVDLGNIKPGETKYYKFNVYNTDEKGTVADTNISYKLKLITTTNLQLYYKLYLNENRLSANASNLLTGTDVSESIISDGYGTFFNVFALTEKCFKYGAEKVDQYTLEVTFPNEYSTSDYQDMVESIKIQLESRQVLPGDNAANQNICR